MKMEVLHLLMQRARLDPLH